MFNSKFSYGVLKHPGYNGKSDAPPAPDYAAAAQQTAAGNLETAKYTTEANRVNQITPYGNLTYNKLPTFNQGAYDKAMAQYNADLANYNQARTNYNAGRANNGINMTGTMAGIANMYNQGPAPVAPIAPTRDTFNTADRWEAVQTLTPAQQDILNKNNALNSGLLGTAQTGLNYANQVLSQPGVNMSGLPSIASNVGTGLPSMTSNVPGGQYATSYGVQNATGNVNNPTLKTSTGANQQAIGTLNNPALQTSSGANYNAQNNLINNANQMVTNANASQQASGNVINPNVQTSLNTSGMPAIKSNVDQYGQIQNSINTSGLPSYGINPGETYADAIMRRLQPDLERQRASEETRLANQGIGLGSNAYSTARDILGRQQNDAMTSAIVQGMQTGLQANQQQFGQNAAQQAASNAAQAQGFGQNAAQTQAQNAANAQAYQQALSSGQFGNQAAGQQFGQNLSAQQLQNQAAAQNNAANLANAGFTNQALSNQFGQNLSANQFANQVGQQNNANALANAQFANQAAGQQFGQGATAAQLQNQAAAQNNALAQSNAQFANQAANTQFGQNVSAAQLANQAAAQNTGNAAQLAAFQNAGVGQQFNQGLANAQLGNQANLQAYNQQLQNAQLQNQAQQQGFTQAAYNQMQPINVINALRTGTQVQNPTYANVPQQAQVAGPDILGATQAGYNAQVANVNAQNAASGNFMNGLMGLGGAALMAPVGTFSDINLKENIKRIGTHDLGIGIYSYNYKDGYDLSKEPQIGVMAQEVETVMPEAVMIMPNGFKAVNYSMLGA